MEERKQTSSLNYSYFIEINLHGVWSKINFLIWHDIAHRRFAKICLRNSHTQTYMYVHNTRQNQRGLKCTCNNSHRHRFNWDSLTVYLIPWWGHQKNTASSHMDFSQLLKTWNKNYHSNLDVSNVLEWRLSLLLIYMYLK